MNDVQLSDKMRALCAYMAGAHSMSLSHVTRERARIHILDTVAAMVSGSRMRAGIEGRAWAKSMGGNGGRCTLIGGSGSVSAIAASVCNGMAAHADESDDSHAPSLSHPGCAVVPAALAVGEEVGASGDLIVRAVVAGYDVGCRIGRALRAREQELAAGGWSSHSIVGTFGAASAASVLYGLPESSVRYVLSYAAQLASGVTTWLRDSHHVEKAFVFAGMPAFHGVMAATLVRSGCDGVEDVFTGRPNWLEALNPQADRAQLAARLGEVFEIESATIKKYTVGSPAQAAVQAAEELIQAYGLRGEQVESVRVRLPSDGAGIVDRRLMPNINVQYLVSGTLLDGSFSFRMAHDEQRIVAPEMQRFMARVTLEHDEGERYTRSATVTVRRRTDEHHEPPELTCTVRDVRGTPANKMSWPEVESKAMDLMVDVVGKDRSATICKLLQRLEDMEDAGEMMPMLSENTA